MAREKVSQCLQLERACVKRSEMNWLSFVALMICVCLNSDDLQSLELEITALKDGQLMHKCIDS